GDKVAAVRAETADALRRIGPDAKAAVPALAGALKDTDVTVQRLAARALGAIGPGAKDAVPALIAGLNNSDSAGECLLALGAIGPDAKEALPALDKMRKEDADAGQFAAEAIKKIEGK